MRLGLFGGSFDPIHMGHVLPVREARRRLGLDRVAYVPTANPPHKPKRPVAPALARYAMVELALLEEEGMVVATHELDPAATSYTVETLQRLREERPGDELVLIVGSDSFRELHEWHRWRDILALARLAVLTRPGWEPGAGGAGLPEEYRRALEGARVDFVANPPVALSSTDIRTALRRGEAPPEGALPALVVKYLQKYPLYR